MGSHAPPDASCRGGRQASVQRVSETGADGEAITVIRVAEAEIGPDLSRRLQSLLKLCFPDYPSRSYFKLPPHFRYLAMTTSGDVAAQMGVELRVIRVGAGHEPLLLAENK
jgi:hypothetical protein